MARTPFRASPLSMLAGISVAGALAGCAPSSGAAPAVCKQATIRLAFRSTCEFTHERLTGTRPIFVGGYLMRTLLAGRTILEREAFLGTAVAYADRLVASQIDDGYWTTGYSKHYYLADTASALGLLFVLADHVDEKRRVSYEQAITRHVAAIERDALVTPTGAIGAGWRWAGEAYEPYRDPYTIASGLTGGVVFTWMYRHTGERRYLETARDALAWVLSTMRDDGVLPYVLRGEGADLAVSGDRANDAMLWETYPYDVSAYVGEGLIAFDTHGDDEDAKKAFREAIRPHIEFLLRSQNPEGTWGVPGSADQKRSPGVVNLLVWYHTRVAADERIERAVCRFATFFDDPRNARAFGLLNAGAPDTHQNRIVTSLTGRALADVIRPGLDVDW